MNGSSIPPSFEDHTSPLAFSNDGQLQVVKQSNPPKSFVVADERDQHVELFTKERKIADAFIAGYDYCDRLARAAAPKVEASPFDCYIGDDVIYDVTLSNGTAHRGRFVSTHHGTPFLSIDLYVPDETKPERMVDVNPAYIVSISVWLD